MDRAFEVSDGIAKEIYNRGYAKGVEDQKEKDNEFFNFEGAWELEKKKVRADAIDECIAKIDTLEQISFGIVTTELVKAMLEQLKEQQ